jgi:hypothetical protein
MQHMIEALREEGLDVVVVQGVVDLPAGFARPHQMQMAQDAQLVRNGRLAHLQAVRQVADAQFAGAQRRDDAHTRRVAEDVEGLGQANGGERV